MKHYIMFSLLLSVALLSGMDPASAQIHIYIKIEGAKQGILKAEPTEKRPVGRGTEWLSLVGVIKTTPAATQNTPIVVTREVDAASPKLWQAVTTNEMLPNVTIEFSKTTAGKESVYRIIKLQQAVIASDKKTPRKQNDAHEFEEVLLRFQKIQIEDIAGSTSTTDDWNASNQ
jgi:type VI secretion system secreted protein Hcp